MKPVPRIYNFVEIDEYFIKDFDTMTVITAVLFRVSHRVMSC